MTIYIILLAYMVLVYFATRSKKIKVNNRNNIYLKITFISIFLLYSLRDSSVGRDLPGYMMVYGWSSHHEWFDFRYVYYEPGYLLLMKLCSQFHLTAQLFLTVVNFIILYPIYKYIKKYSSDYFLSSITYVCYLFFEFNMTGIRQAIASSIVLIAYIVVLESKKCSLIKYMIIVGLAAQFHKGAWIALILIPVYYMKRLTTYTLSITAVSVFLLFTRGYIMSCVKKVFGKQTMDASAKLYIGLNFVFLIILAVLFVYAAYVKEQKTRRMLQERDEIPTDYYYLKKVNDVNIKLFLLSISIVIIFGSDNAVRSFMFLNQVVLIQLPNCLNALFSGRSKLIAKFLFFVFLVFFFFENTLISGGFDIVPYKFFWQM